MEGQDDEDTVIGILGKEGKAISCSIRTWSLRLTVDVLDRGDTTGGDDTILSAPSGKAPSITLNDFCLLMVLKVEVVVHRAFLLEGSIILTSISLVAL